jgi:hypothetical protein
MKPADEATGGMNEPARTVEHGRTCIKAPHQPMRTGYLHRADDDRPYDVDGLLYCGRCHVYLEAR